MRKTTVLSFAVILALAAIPAVAETTSKHEYKDDIMKFVAQEIGISQKRIGYFPFHAAEVQHVNGLYYQLRLSNSGTIDVLFSMTSDDIRVLYDFRQDKPAAYYGQKKNGKNFCYIFVGGDRGDALYQLLMPKFNEGIVEFTDKP